MPEDDTPTNPTPEPAPPTPPPAPPETPPTESTPEPDEPLGDAGQRALQRERDRRIAAEKASRDAKARIEALEQEMTESQRLKQEAKESRKLAATATKQLRQANLLNALAGKGLVGPKAKAASKLLDELEFTEGHEPANLDDRLEAAKATYGADLFASATPAAAPAPTPAHQDYTSFQGPRQPPGNDEDKQFDAFFRQAFPQATRPSAN